MPKQESNEPESVKKNSYPIFYRVIHSAIVGGVSGCIEVLVNHPLMTIKNCIQEDRRVSLKPKDLYKGIIPNATSMIAIIGSRVIASNFVLYTVFGIQHPQNATLIQKMLSGYSGGLAASLIAGPVELAILYQQKHKVNFSTAIIETSGKGERISNLTRGMLAAGCRDGFNTVGFFAVVPALKKGILPYCKNDLVASAIAGPIAGVISAVLSQPFDVIKTKQQGTSPVDKSYSIIKAAELVYKERGAIGFFKGLIPRGTRVASAITVLGYTTEKVTHILDEASSKLFKP